MQAEPEGKYGDMQEVQVVEVQVLQLELQGMQEVVEAR